MTAYPFVLRDDLVARLPPPSQDGFHYVDVKVREKWDGSLVVDTRGSCTGVYVGRRTEELPLPFDASDIEDVRPACLINRVLGSLPFDLWDGALVIVFVVSPVVLLLANLMLPALGLLSILGCAAAICLMYQTDGFPLIRLPAALLGLVQMLAGTILVIRWILSW